VNKIASGATGPRRLMLLIGEVKEFAAARSGHKLVVKHLPGFPFLLRDGLHRRMTTRFERELTLWDAVAGAHLLAIATFGVGSGGVPEVEELALMVVTETWIPIEHIYDSQPRCPRSNRRTPNVRTASARSLWASAPGS
jgi:hypothetical protein